MRTIGRLHVITDAALQHTRGHVELAELALLGGASTVQYRRKDGHARLLLREAISIRMLCRKHKASFIVNDRADIALAADADGVHLGADDLPLSIARDLLGPSRVIGGSADNADEAVALGRLGFDYLGIGPVFATTSKHDTGPVLGLQGLADAVRRASIPLIAIGGISLANVDSVLETGVHGIAVLGAIALADDPAAATQALRDALDRHPLP